MDMDHLIGQRFNLISKSEIRYVGTLHEINPEQSTIALEDVYSFGTESRKADNFIPASQQKFDYIVFRGSDVKDIKIAEEQKENKQPEPQNVLNDPAILNSSRPNQGPPRQGPPPQNRDQAFFPPPPPGYPAQQLPPQPPFGGRFPPNQFGRGYGQPPLNFQPGPGFNHMPYGPPPPGYFGPGAPPFPQGPNYHSPQMPGQRPSGAPGQQYRPPPGSMQPPQSTSELPVDDKAPEKAVSKTATPAPPQEISTPIVETKPSVSEAPASASQATVAPAPLAAVVKGAPMGPKSNRVTPAVPFTVNQKSFIPPAPAATNSGPLSAASVNVPQSSKPTPSAAAMEEASRQAKEAVAAAMAKLNPSAVQPRSTATSNAVDALTKKVNEMRTADGNTRGSRGGLRGQRGNPRGGPGPHSRKIEIPKSDYDFESANAKFNKEDLVKEAIASGSPVGETAENATNGTENETPVATNGENASSTQSYNKSSSFFDNISSESKDREEERNQTRGRVWRGEEVKKNIETFGQGSIDGGGFRGRGRGFRGRGRPYGGQNRGFAGRGTGFRAQGGNGQEFAQS